jgi:hypothetical protein
MTTLFTGATGTVVSRVVRKIVSQIQVDPIVARSSLSN